jgi:hypothetical protein
VKITEIIEALRSKLAVPIGRHLYGVLGNYSSLEDFVDNLHQAKMPDGSNFPKPLNVNKCILESIPDDEFKQLVENEAKRPEPTAKHVENAFRNFLRSNILNNLVILENLELIFAYNLELDILRTFAADENRILLLLPGMRNGNRIVMFPEWTENSFTLPTNLIAENHLWEIK